MSLPAQFSHLIGATINRNGTLRATATRVGADTGMLSPVTIDSSTSLSPSWREMVGVA